uniref:Uncharacterized protein n=1 Tax=Pipistrellus kuhlii TaxID=59472 RepID=A0A7J7YXK4_PIPKU|nr:hypothetical protein mPipKuh1_009927 [Pipistrellus kuhlii]
MSLRAARPTFPFVRAKKGLFFSSRSRWSRCPPRITWPAPRVRSGLTARLPAPGQPRGGHRAILCAALCSNGAGPRLLLGDPFKPVPGEMGYELPGQRAMGRARAPTGLRPLPIRLGLLEPVGSRGSNSFCCGEKGRIL